MYYYCIVVVCILPTLIQCHNVHISVRCGKRRDDDDDITSPLINICIYPFMLYFIRYRSIDECVCTFLQFPLTRCHTLLSSIFAPSYTSKGLAIRINVTTSQEDENCFLH
jgi:hypothetical protein